MGLGIGLPQRAIDPEQVARHHDDFFDAETRGHDTTGNASLGHLRLWCRRRRFNQLSVLAGEAERVLVTVERVLITEQPLLHELHRAQAHGVLPPRGSEQNLA